MTYNTQRKQRGGASLIIILIIAGVLVLGGGLYFFSDSDEQEATGTETGNEEQALNPLNDTTNSVRSGSGSIRSLLALGGNIRCSFTYDSEQGRVEGTTYIMGEGERLRGDFTMDFQGETYETSVINADGMGYTWGQTPFGVVATKFAVSNDDDTESGDDAGLDFDEEVSYECHPWSVDRSKFVPPSDIEFTDLTATILELNQVDGDVKAQQCAACEQIPDENGKAQCLAALGCS